MRIKLNGLHLQLVGLIILPLGLLVLAIAFAAVNLHQNAMRQLVAERDERSARAAASVISEQLHHRQAAVHSLALRLKDEVSPSAILHQANYLSHDFNEGMAITDQSGLILVGQLSAETWPIEWLHGIEGDAVLLSEPFEGDDGEWSVLAAARQSDQFAIGAFSVNSLVTSEIISPSSGNESFSVMLVDARGNLLTSEGSVPNQDNLLDHAGVQAALRGEIGSTFIPAADGEHVVAFSPIHPVDWAFIVEENWEDVSSPLLNITLMTPLALAPVLLITLFALWFGARRVVQPLRNLEQRAEKMAGGDYETIEESAGGIAEIQNLQQTLISMAGRIRSAQQALRGYIGSITRTQEDERRRLARDLHDETIQDLIALDQQIQMIGMSLRQQGLSNFEAVEKLHKDTQESIQKVRRLSRGLRPIYLEDLGLIPALEMLAKDIETDLQIPISFNIEGFERRLDPVVEVAVYRIVQEALSNVGRHANAKRAWITVTSQDEILQITIGDDGEGFEMPPQASELAYKGHYGLIGMYERVELIKGNLTINSTPGQGTIIYIKIPLMMDIDNSI